MGIPVLYQDENILCVNKPSGLLSIQDGYNAQMPFLRSVLEEEFGRLWIVHRLDRETSGVVLLARNEKAHKYYNERFLHRAVEKTYVAIVLGKPDLISGTINSPLLVDGDRKHRTVVSPKLGKSASTYYQVVSRSGIFVLLRIIPHNGYTHQIRAHLSSISSPILSDFLYQPGLLAQEKLSQSCIIPRVALHALSLRISRENSDASLTICAPIPQDFETALQKCNLIWDTSN